MAEYRYPQKLERLHRGIILICAAAGTALLSVHWWLTQLAHIRPGITTTVDNSDILVYFLRPEDVFSAKVVSAAFLGLRLIPFWAFVFLAWLVVSRVCRTVYILDPPGLTRIRGKARRSMPLSAVTGVAVKSLRGLVLETPHTSLSVSLNVESAADLVRQLRKEITGSGGAFPDAVYAKATTTAAYCAWQIEHLGLLTTISLLLGAVLASAGYWIAAALQMGTDARLLSAWLSLCMTLVQPAFLRLLVRARFRSAFEEGWTAPGRLYAYRGALTSVVATVAVYSLLACAVLYVLA